MENVLSVRGLTKRYDKFALKDVSFDVRRGEIMGFIGRNGAGKTTTLKSLMNYLHPDAGEIDFFGKPMTRRRISAALPHSAWTRTKPPPSCPRA